MKKLNKFFAVLVALAMMLTLGIVSAFAEGEQSAAKEVALNDAYLTKQLNTPAGITDIPTIDAVFEFELDTLKSSGLSDAEKAAKTPAIADQTITVTGAANQTTSGQKALSTFAPTFSHAGVYAYTVKEKSATITGVANLVNNSDATVTKDSAEYTLRFYVVAETENDVTTYRVKYVTVNREVAGNAGETGKVDASKTDGTGFNFVNNYAYKDGKEPQNPEGPITPEEKAKFALVIEKEVTNHDNDTQGFPIQVNLGKALGQTDNTVTGIVYKKVNGQDVKDREETFTYGQNKTVTLKTGEYLAFATLPTGTTWTASELLNNETAYQVYTPSFAGKANDVAISGNAGAGQTLATETYTLAQDKEDNVKYTNAYDDALNTPTGILINNLPYIALALVAIGGLVAYVVVRRRDEDNA